MMPISEQSALKLSILVTALTGVAGIVGGLAIGSRAILFEGMYSFIDVMLTFGSLAVSKLLMQGPTRRFQFGYWRLEPLVGVVQSALLATTCIYAAFNAIQGLMSGGHTISFGFGMIWASALSLTGFAMAAFVSRLARAHNSILLAVDARSWLISGCLSFALLLAFAIALGLERSPYGHWVPYVDPAVLLCMSLAVLPVPLKTLFSAARDVLDAAPDTLDARVRSVMDAMVKEKGFLSYSSHVAQVGRGRFVEIHILVPADLRIESVQAVDSLRREIAGRLEASWPQTWLTVDLTADPEWM